MTSTAPLASPELPPRRRRVWPWVLLVVGALIVAAGVALDVLARSLAENAIADQVRSSLEVPPGTEVRASIGGGPMFVQALSGGLERVDVDVPGLALGALTGDLEIVAQGVPFDTAAPTRDIEVRYAVPEEALVAVSPELAGVTVERVAIEGGEVVASGSTSVFGSSFSLGLGLTPSAVDGELAFDPTSIRIGDSTLTAEQLRADPLFGGLADALLQARRICIADALPAALVLEKLEIDGSHLVATLDASGAAIGGEGFSAKGVCA
ncbi:DUF2993 domain-containing protein [Protaetiibacter sp. SSC-01]|uniref:LmeA family phospholipid-binding protein n=1 Tax=Protaetiibacter sp. SSC-01 TaxID=2759943 RepID=UPI001656D0D1|nr:DUF2993 domain-containing protein [Protaetiibacter sp. SSC-01]QNO38509.1 DUF2993 domain-containing protein [Protaetiibacter sp. SSC-01]